MASIQTYTDSITDRSFNGSHAVEITVGKNEQCVYYIDQDVQKAEGVISHRFMCKERSQLTVNFFALGGNQVANMIEIVLVGTGAKATITGAYAGTDSHHNKLKIMQDHQAPHTTSFSSIKAAIADSAFLRYDGMIHIAGNAVGADAALYNKNILLSKSARAVSVPGLEVKTHEVQCKHGTASGRFDDDQVLYMQSRGLSRLKAEQVMLHGFFTEGVSLSKQQVGRLIAKLTQE